MADTYAVTPQAVADELKTLDGAGFSASTTPTEDTVESWITAADLIVTLHVQRAAAQVPASTDQAGPLAVRYIIAFVKAEVMRAKYAGNAPEKIEAAAKPYADQAAMLLAEIDQLGVQMVGSGTITNRVRSSASESTNPRLLLVRDEHLGPTSTTARTRAY